MDRVGPPGSSEEMGSEMMFQILAQLTISTQLLRLLRELIELSRHQADSSPTVLSVWKMQSIAIALQSLKMDQVFSRYLKVEKKW